MRALLRRGDAAMTLGLLLVFAVMVGEATRYPRDSRLFPVIVGTAGLLMAAVLLWRLARGRTPRPLDEEAEAAGDGSAAPLWAALLAAPAFAMVMWAAGFWVATALCCFFGPAVMGHRDLRSRVALALGTLAAMAVLFPLVLNLPLPRGEIMERYFQAPDDEDE